MLRFSVGQSRTTDQHVRIQNELARSWHGMTQAVAHGSLANPPSAPPRHAPHGQKRAAETSLEPEQRLSKRFDLLNLGTLLSGV